MGEETDGWVDGWVERWMSGVTNAQRASATCRKARTGRWRLRGKQASVQSHLASQWLCVNLNPDPLPVPHYPVGLGRPSSLSASVCQGFILHDLH